MYKSEILMLCLGLLILSACHTDRERLPDTMHGSKQDTAIFAGGCFWCVESDFEKLEGVIDAISGYTGGRTNSPSYENVSKQKTGHYEAVKVIFDPSLINYGELVDYYWGTIDPTDLDGQFCDRGMSYRSAVFARPDQIETARQSRENIVTNKPFHQEFITPILEAKTFYAAEAYHQNYYKMHSLKYKFYRKRCGRDSRLKELWSK